MRYKPEHFKHWGVRIPQLKIEMRLSILCAVLFAALALPTFLLDLKLAIVFGGIAVVGFVKAIGANIVLANVEELYKEDLKLKSRNPRP